MGAAERHARLECVSEVGEGVETKLLDGVGVGIASAEYDVGGREESMLADAVRRSRSSRPRAEPMRVVPSLFDAAVSTGPSAV